ncbi:MAG: archease [Crenarchaeota archaeon]|nr:archease [Thermoproteota archaeon]MCR8454863.1 archease [Thermoproteota archaeon]MCR8472715.1 archease [Thermoproteota archaeon]MCR8487856.1 archease [Thermoproteota archaeon]MCR8501186.1 archease [Thermoproteota archaeon]
MKKDFEIIEKYTADVAFIAYGRDLEELLINSARALTAIQVDLRNVEPKECVEISIEAQNLLSFLRKWLEEFLYLRDARRLFISRITDISINIKLSSREEDIISVTAKVCGEEFNPQKHGGSVEIKAVSYHDMEVGFKDNMWYAHVLVDI